MRKFINYELKKKAIESGYCSIAKKFAYATNLYVNGFIDYNHYSKFEKSIRNLDGDLFKEAIKINKATYNRNNRLQNRISDMLSMGSCLFLTLTFTDETLQKTTKETRRRYIIRFLNSYSNLYVANIDYGRINEREHYHAVILLDSIDFNSWTYGNLDVQRIRYNDSDKKLACYISKLTNHAIKESTKGNRIIYSRGKKNER